MLVLSSNQFCLCILGWMYFFIVLFLTCVSYHRHFFFLAKWKNPSMILFLTSTKYMTSLLNLRIANDWLCLTNQPLVFVMWIHTQFYSKLTMYFNNLNGSYIFVKEFENSSIYSIKKSYLLPTRSPRANNALVGFYLPAFILK